jgi:sulfite exporter TauE/SafE
VIGVILWVTVMPVIGWILMVVGALLIVAGLLMGAVWTFSRAGRRGPAY